MQQQQQQVARQQWQQGLNASRLEPCGCLAGCCCLQPLVDSTVQLYKCPAWFMGQSNTVNTVAHCQHSQNIASQTLSTHCLTGQSNTVSTVKHAGSMRCHLHPTSWPQLTAMQPLALMKRGPSYDIMRPQLQFQASHRGPKHCTRAYRPI